LFEKRQEGKIAGVIGYKKEQHDYLKAILASMGHFEYSEEF
jgi:hypothetical protein